MSDLHFDSDENASKGSQPSLIEAFGIRGLHGYRNIALSTESAATILIARNGSGKTTLLAVLNAFLRCHFFKLHEIKFESIFCKFRGIPEQLILYRSDLDEIISTGATSDFFSLAASIGKTPEVLYKFITEDWEIISRDIDDRHQNQVYAALLQLSDYSRIKVEKQINDLYNSLYRVNTNVSRIYKTVRNILRERDIVYLPTYRRVELALREKNEERYRRKRPRFDVAAGSLFSGDIQFGLTDISYRLRELNEKIVFDSNNEYRKISANIINELIDGLFDNYIASTESTPARDDLELLFSRVEQGRRVGPYHTVSVPNLEKLYGPEGIPASSVKFLSYFLNQLNKVIITTKEVEIRVQEFIYNCNKYLTSSDIITDMSDDEIHDFDGKRLTLNRKNLQVDVISVPDELPIPLDSLSSGEKQMISLFAKLFLYEGPKIVLIDEPELSLSIDWQRQILVDVMNSPLCEQLIAITHSPFVFDNELEPYAGALQVKTTRSERQLSHQERLSFEDDSFDE